MSDNDGKTCVRHGLMGSEVVQRNMVDDATLKTYNDFNGGVVVGIDPDSVSHKDFSAGLCPAIVLDNGLG